MSYRPPHLPIVHIDAKSIVHNFNLLNTFSAPAKAQSHEDIAKVNLNIAFGDYDGEEFEWPSQLAVIKADAYGHNQKEAAFNLIPEDVRMYASGSVQECLHLRESFDKIVILCLLGPIDENDVKLCAKNRIIPVIHCFEQIKLLAKSEVNLPIAIKCNTGMARLGFDEHELNEVITSLKQLTNITPVLALSHLHSADNANILVEIKTQGTHFARMLKSLRQAWPKLAASLANSAGTIFADEIKSYIGPHICRPGIALYGANPFYNTELASKIVGLKPAMWVSTNILAIRELKKGQGIGYGHTFVANEDLRVAILACGYADGYSRGLSNKGMVCIAGQRVPIIGRVAMQMIAADISKLKEENPKQAWLLSGPFKEGIGCEELAKAWGTISYEVLCALGNNERNYVNFNNLHKLFKQKYLAEL